MRKKKRTKNKQKKLTQYETIIMCFEKVNESLSVLHSVSKSLKSSASILKGPIKSNLSEIDKNLKTTANLIKDIKAKELAIKEPKYPVFDAKDFKLI